jgi:hypothetical protein
VVPLDREGHKARGRGPGLRQSLTGSHPAEPIAASQAQATKSFPVTFSSVVTTAWVPLGCSTKVPQARAPMQWTHSASQFYMLQVHDLSRGAGLGLSEGGRGSLQPSSSFWWFAGNLWYLSLISALVSTFCLFVF